MRENGDVRPKSSRTLYVLLFLYVAASLTYYVAGATAMLQEFFRSAEHVKAPFTITGDGESITALRNEAKDAGLNNGDILQTLNGSPFTGEMQLENLVRHSRPGDMMRVGVQAHNGQTKDVHLRLHAWEGPDFHLGGYIAYLTPVLLVPLLSLIVGYWVVAARPRDPNAWLVLALLTAPEILFGNLDWRFWAGTWSILLGTWYVCWQHLLFIALLWFGIYFPDRWRVDVQWPSIKWLLTLVTLAGFVIELRINEVQFFHASRMPRLLPLENWTDRISGWAMVVCIVVFLVAIFDKLRSASTPDARRRLRVLAVGSSVSLIGMLIIYGLLPHLNSSLPQWLVLTSGLLVFILFPLTLAYVVVVQRAMDLRILLRMGTKYLLAKVTLIVVQIAIIAWAVFRVFVPLIERNARKGIYVVLITGLIILALRTSTLKRRFGLGSRLHRWIDRRFFREAYNAEVVLSELSEQTRSFTDRQPLIEMVSRRISEVLHVREVAVWLRGSNVFHLQHAVGLDIMGPLLLPAASATVQHLVRTNRPATLYRDRPEAWFDEAGAEERHVLDTVDAELLLALPGRNRLMGVMALGPKLSEEPYTPTDLRVLQSVAMQTGLALEVTELAHSLAEEAAQRERMNREMEIAREVQQRFFPQHIPNIPGLSLAGMCRPAYEVGGDYYDLIELDDGRLGIAIGDISGKGISAALLMASLRASLRGMTLDSPSDLAKTLNKVNRLVYEASSNNRYATFFFATYNPATCDLWFVNAGHNPPFLIRAAANGQGNPLRLETGGLVVGLLPNAQYQEECMRMEPGDVLLTYTDGISEAMTADDEEWGEERMFEAARAARDGSAEEILQAIFQAADQFTAEAPQHDDMTLLIMKLEACPRVS